VQLVEQHCIRKNDPRYAVIDEAAFRSKNLYNAAWYEMRQTFFNEGRYLKYEEIQRRMQPHEAYKALPAKVSQQILMLLANNWESFKEAKKAYEQDPSRFTGRPRLPRYKHKTDGRNILVYTVQAVSKRGLEKGLIQPSMLPIEVQTKQKAIHQVRIIPRNGHYVVEVIYSKKAVQAEVDPSFCVGIDLGVTNLAAITANREGFIPRLVNGRPIKSVNQWYNKRMKELKLCLPKDDRERVTKQMEQITTKRNRQVNHYLHAASKCIIDFLIEQGVGTIIIQVEIREESYTSKASFVALDPIPTYTPNDKEEHIFSGKRIGRRNRLYRTKDGRKICADVNGSYNILRKSRPDAFAHAGAKGIAAYVVQPVRLAIPV
jgi:putative transposase